MELQTISKVSKDFGISPRMLRYYEQIGLIHSLRKDDYAYRVYDETAVSRLRLIIVLRKLQIPVKQIISILNNKDAVETAEIFRQNISRLDEEITSLSTVKAILMRFTEELREKSDINLKLLTDEAMFSVINSLSFSDNQIKKKENLSMEELNKANEKIGKLTDRDVRIIYIPPSDVAAYQFEGDNPEGVVNNVISKFVKDSNLVQIKPDIRHFGFNAPNPKDETNYHGYEMWVTIPDGFDVPAPLVKKRMSGGMYCAHMIPIGAFDEWAMLEAWLNTGNNKYKYNGNGRPDNMFDSLEECLNYPNHTDGDWDGNNVQLDLLIPIKEK
ncbi:MAG: effector binding domain-containing protein [Oscillospiraceae bacterium]|nr:effector binding domain-containing protein [Oscillospiraceae bacterium]